MTPPVHCICPEDLPHSDLHNDFDVELSRLAKADLVEIDTALQHRIALIEGSNMDNAVFRLTFHDTAHWAMLTGADYVA